MHVTNRSESSHSVKEKPRLIVVIPCYKEPGILETLRSLYSCDRGDFPVEIILAVNSYRKNSESTRDLNRKSYLDSLRFAEENNTPSFYLTPLLFEDLPGHQTGAGVPRRLGMEEAIRHFQGDKRGILVSLDGDCLVERNYLTELFRCFHQYKLNSATIEFHHPVEHLAQSDPLRIATESYELYLRYYRSALEFCGFPYAYYTIGSAFAVTAGSYLKAGGMGKQQSGEDFYFLHKVFPQGKTRFIDTTCVYPAARTSDRVPFGTGPALARMVKERQTEKLTYQFQAFAELKLFFDLIPSFFKTSPEIIAGHISGLPDYLSTFLQENDFPVRVEEFNSHTSSPENFKKRFFSWFSAFRILKYLNSVHPEPFSFRSVREEYEKVDTCRTAVSLPQL